MKKIKRAAVVFMIFVMLFTIFCMTECNGEKSDYTQIFEKDRIIDVSIEIDEADLEDIRNYPQNEEYHTADITVDGIKVENAGIRTKGNMTLKSVADSESERYSYRIKFNKYVSGNKLLGLDELCLNNGYSDPSYMREYLHYEALRGIGVAVPETAFARVYINGEYAGFYLAVEGLDSTFLKDNFGEDYKNGNFYKMDEGATLKYKENEEYTYADLKSGDDTDMRGFKDFVKKLNDMPDGEKGDIEEVLDVDSALKYIASNTVLCNYDSYNGNMHHNYYLYEDPNGIFTVVPWDFNMSFGGFNGTNAQVGIDTPYISGSAEELPLIGKLLSVDEYKERYYGYIKELMDYLEDFDKRVENLKKKIDSYVKADTTAFYDYDEFEKATSTNSETEAVGTEPESGKGRGKGGMGGVSITECAAERLENLTKQFAGEAEKTSQASGRGFGDDHRKGGGFGENGGEPPEMPQGGRFGQNGGGHKSERKDNKSDAVRVHLNGHILSFNQEPYMVNDTVLVGFRSVLEALGADVMWDEATQTVTALKDETEIKFTIGSNTAYVNGEECDLIAAAELNNDTAMIPVRFISEKLGMKVKWDESGKLVVITSK